MVTSLEQRLSAALRASLEGIDVGASIPDSPRLQVVLEALSFYLPAVLREVHAEWKHESLDGVFAELARKTSNRQVELAGMCVLIRDQGLTPYYASIRVAAGVDEVEYFDCKVGEVRNNEMVRIPYNSDKGGKQCVADRLASVVWKYHVGFGTSTT